MRKNLALAAVLATSALLAGVVGLSAAPAADTNGGDGGKVIRLTATVAQQRFIGDPNHPQLGDRFIVNVDVFDDSKTKVGRSGTSCTVVSVPPRAVEVECLGDTVLAQGKITTGGLAPFPPSSTAARFSILGGTGEFRKARGEFVVSLKAPNRFDGTFYLSR